MSLNFSESSALLFYLAQVRKELYKEGEVLYFLNKNEETIGLVKAKTTWYIMMRALREKAVYCFITAKKKSNWSLQDYVNSTHKRFGQIQEWLKFSDSYLQSWKVRDVIPHLSSSSSHIDSFLVS